MSILARVLDGVRRTIWVGITLCVIAILVYPRSPQRGRMTLTAALSIYLGAALLSGAILGLLIRNVRESRLGMTLLGIPVAWPATLAIAVLSDDGRLNITWGEFVGSFIAAAILGSIGGAYAYYRIASRTHDASIGTSEGRGGA